MVLTGKHPGKISVEPTKPRRHFRLQYFYACHKTLLLRAQSSNFSGKHSANLTPILILTELFQYQHFNTLLKLYSYIHKCTHKCIHSQTHTHTKVTWQVVSTSSAYAWFSSENRTKATICFKDVPTNCYVNTASLYFQNS